MMKKAISILLTVLMLIGVMAPLALAAEGDNSNYTFCLTYADIQGNKTSPDLRYGTNSNHILWQLLPSVNGRRAIYLAKNEHEGFQVFFYEKTAARTLDIQVEDFVNDKGEKLACSLFNEKYMQLRGDGTDDFFAEALIPYNHEGVETVKNENNMFYIELHSTPDQTPGNYYSKITLSDENGVLETVNLVAVVWNFALPENHLSTYLCGLYNSGSGYSATLGFLKLGGVRVVNGQIVEEDKELAEEILEGWDDFLLEYGISSYEIPAFLIEKDEKEAQLAMADPRRSMFMVPANFYSIKNGKFVGDKTVNDILKYKELVGDSQVLKDKAFFYPYDEPSWSATNTDTTNYDNRIAAVRDIWGESAHTMVPFAEGNVDSYVNYKRPKLLETTDIFCPNQSTVVNYKPVREDFLNHDWHKTLRYCGDTWVGNTYVWSWGKSTKGGYARILSWQASITGTDGMLHWNCGYVNPYFENDKPFDALKLGLVPGGEPGTPQTLNGDGIFVYQGASLGLDPRTPVSSIRLKWISDGMDDYDYLELAREFLGEEQYQKFVCSMFPHYSPEDPLKNRIWGEGYRDFEGNSCLDWTSWECTTINAVRRSIGNALSAANTENEFEHNFGDWETTVTPDEMHNGLEIRTCANCGAQETNKLEKLTCKHENTTVLPAVEASCTKTGLTEGKKCSVCGIVLTEQTTVAMKAHTEVVLPAVAATCTTPGLTEGKKCSVCEKVLKEQTKTDKLPHADNDGDNLCDTCGKDLSVKCSCNCHKSGFMGFIWKILRFFYKLFGTNKTCACGVAHY